MRTLILLLILAGVAAVAVATKPCMSDDCNYGERCYTTSQCDCDLVCRVIPGNNPFGDKACQF